MKNNNGGHVWYIAPLNIRDIWLDTISLRSEPMKTAVFLKGTKRIKLSDQN